MPRYKYSSILNKKTAKAHQKWYSMKPTERYKLMKKVGSTKKSNRGIFSDIISYLEKN